MCVHSTDTIILTTIQVGSQAYRELNGFKLWNSSKLLPVSAPLKLRTLDDRSHQFKLTFLTALACFAHLTWYADVTCYHCVYDQEQQDN